MRGRCASASRRGRDERRPGLARPFFADDEANGFQEDPHVFRQRVVPYVAEVVLNFLVVREV